MQKKRLPLPGGKKTLKKLFQGLIAVNMLANQVPQSNTQGNKYHPPKAKPYQHQGEH